jgi:hypothetical protein
MHSVGDELVSASTFRKLCRGPRRTPLGARPTRLRTPEVVALPHETFTRKLKPEVSWTSNPWSLA